MISLKVFLCAVFGVCVVVLAMASPAPYDPEEAPEEIKLDGWGRELGTVLAKPVQYAWQKAMHSLDIFVCTYLWKRNICDTLMKQLGGEKYSPPPEREGTNQSVSGPNR